MDKVTQLPEDHSYYEHEYPILGKWKSEETYKKLMELRKGGQLYRFMDGPPFPSSKSLHFGHLMIGDLKSTVLYYMWMHGYNCLNVLGYDCHGLPTEMATNKILNISTKHDVEKLGVDKYNESCDEFVESCLGAWTPIYERIGRWADFSNTYKTKDLNFMESVWWVFQQIYNKGLVYNSYTVMPFSTGCGTSLSNFEAGNNYKLIDTLTVYAYFALKDDPSIGFVAWTTTPWTLPSNIALCVNPSAKYIMVYDEKSDRKYIVAEDCLEKSGIVYTKIVEGYSKLGSELVGTEYIPLFPYMKREKYVVLSDTYVKITPLDKLSKKKKSTVKTVAVADDEEDEGEEVDISTGIVHLAPVHGVDDFRVCTTSGLIDAKDVNNVCPVDDAGKFMEQVTDYAGEYVFDVSLKIIEDLKAKKLVIRTQKIRHKYPHCYRTETPLIYKACSSVFIEVSALRDQFLANNEKISWTPDSIKHGRFGLWLKNAKDWAVERKNRYFGTPLPLWISDDGEEIICVGSIDELMELAQLKERPTNLHKQFTDKIEIPSKRGKGMLKSISSVFDCWFESGCVPFAQIHYPFENKELLDLRDYLSDFVAEGLDQTRGWFYTLMVISTILKGTPPFKKVICTGLILDEHGVKFSKKNNNFKDPMITLDKFGADVMRLYLLASPVMHGDSLLFTEDNIDKTKQKLIPWVNAVKFTLEHTISFHKKGNVLDRTLVSDNITDRWIISKLGTLLRTVEDKMKDYQVDQAINQLLGFIEILTNWYVKFNRDRLKGLNGVEEWKKALVTMHKVAYYYNLIMAPFTPFLSEHLYSHLKCIVDVPLFDSIHHTMYPDSSLFPFDEEIERKMETLQNVSSLIRSFRSTVCDNASLKVPIKKIVISHNNSQFINDIKELEEFITDELNVLSVEYNALDDNLKYIAYPDNKNLGQKFTHKATLIRDNLEFIPQKELLDLLNGTISQIVLELEGVSYELTSSEIVIKKVPIGAEDNPNIANLLEGEIMISIDKTYDEEIHKLFQMRKVIRKVQDMRKVTDLHPWDKVCITFSQDVGLYALDDQLKERLKTEILYEDTGNRDKLVSELDFSWTTFTGESKIVHIVIQRI
jgi:isoleucyl-tRNA synthetase